MQSSLISSLAKIILLNWLVFYCQRMQGQEVSVEKLAVNLSEIQNSRHVRLPQFFDKIHLHHQGVIFGKLLTTDPAAEVYEVQLFHGGIIEIEAAEIESIDRKAEALKQYFEICAQFADTAEEQWKLVAWCREHGLMDQSLNHCQRVLIHAPDHVAARRLLGDQYQDGKWISREELLKQKGYTYHQGSWKPLIAAAYAEAKNRQQQIQLEWKLKLRQWRKQLNQIEARQSDLDFQSLKDPNAVGGIIYLLGREENPALTAAYLEKLSKIGSADAIQFLMFHSVFQNRDDLRSLCLKQVLHHRRPQMIEYYVEFLDHYDNQIVNRAAVALAALEYPAAVVQLANALETRHLAFQNSREANQTYFPSQDRIGPCFDTTGPRPSSIHLTLTEFLATTPNLYAVQTLQNAEVRNALMKLTGGEDYGYDRNRWKTWRNVTLSQKTPLIRGQRDE